MRERVVPAILPVQPQAKNGNRSLQNQMATLSVRNVGPIREADIEIKKHTVFIGPQGSGKSTLAKLIAIGEDEWVLPKLMYMDLKLGQNSAGKPGRALDRYGLKTFFENLSEFFYRSSDGSHEISKSENIPNLSIHLAQYLHDFQEDSFISRMDVNTTGEVIMRSPSSEPSLYIPTERNVFPILSDSIWSFIKAKINLPESVTEFGYFLEEARNTHSEFHIPFLNIRYSRESGRDLVYFDNDKSIPLSQSASGYQAIIPLLLVVEHQRRQAKRRFIIEEPELNLYPTTQKELIYALISGLDPTAKYHDAEWVFTTHSPYILSSLNTLLLAWKVAHTSDELREKVEEIIPARCWINPDDFAAYYVDKGTVRSIIQKDSGFVDGLIDDNELDDVSGLLADEQNQLLDLYRSTVNA